MMVFSQSRDGGFFPEQMRGCMACYFPSNGVLDVVC